MCLLVQPENKKQRGENDGEHSHEVKRDSAFGTVRLNGVHAGKGSVGIRFRKANDAMRNRKQANLSTPFHKYDHVCGEGFLAQTRRERRAYPSGVCKERATTSGPTRTAAQRVAPLFGSGFVTPRSQPHFGGCSLVAPRQNRKATQQTWSYL